MYLLAALTYSGSQVWVVFGWLFRSCFLAPLMDSLFYLVHDVACVAVCVCALGVLRDQYATIGKHYKETTSLPAWRPCVIRPVEWSSRDVECGPGCTPVNVRVESLLLASIDVASLREGCSVFSQPSHPVFSYVLWCDWRVNKRRAVTVRPVS